MLEFKTFTDIQKFTVQKNDHINDGFSRIPKYGERKLTKRIKPQEYALLCLLHEYLNTTNGHCYPKHATLLTQIKAGESSLDTYLHNLEKAGFIRRIPARKVTNKGKYDFTSSEIIIVPIEYVDDSEYHKAIDRFIDENKYVIVSYSGKSRKVIGTGKKKDRTVKAIYSESHVDAAITPVENPQPLIDCQPVEDIAPVNIPVVLNSVEEKPVSIPQTSVYITPPSRKRPTVTEEELEQAHTEFQVLREIPGILSEVDMDKVIEKMVNVVRRYGYKPGYRAYIQDKINKMMGNPYYAARPKDILLTLQSDHLTVWYREASIYGYYPHT